MSLSPVIIIPGIKGTKLANTNGKDHNIIWSGIQSNYERIDLLSLKEDGITDLIGEVVIEKLDIENLAYGEIIKVLRGKGFPVYIFGYDWRKSNLISGQNLYEYVNMIKRKHPGKKISFVTHSMGCLVLSGLFRYIEAHAKIDSLVDKVVFTVPPFLGAPDAIRNLILGDSTLFNGKSTFRKIARTMPGLYELLPVYEGVFSNIDNFDIYNYKNWQQRISNPDPTAKLYFELRLTDLKKNRKDNSYIYDFSNLPLSIRERMLILVGEGEKTLLNIEVIPNEGRFKNYFNFIKPEFKKGDGTVPLVSALAFESSIKTIKLKQSWLEQLSEIPFIQNSWHAFFLESGRVQKTIKEFLI